MPLPDFEVHRPASIEQASDMLRDPEAVAMLGGTELILLMKLGFLEPSDVVLLGGLSDLQGVEATPGTVRIGAALSHTAIAHHPDLARLFPLLTGVEAGIANVRVRNTGTLGGNLAFADPHSDAATVLVALGGRVRVSDGRSERAANVEEFLVAPYEPALDDGELVVGVELPRTPLRGYGYERFAPQERPVVNCAVVDGGEGSVDVVVGCVGGKPQRLAAAAGMLGGGALDSSALRAAVADEVVLRSQADLDEDYLRHVVCVLVERAARVALA